MNCDVLSRYLEMYLDGELAVEERVEVEVHMRECEGCRVAVTQESRFRQMMRQSLLAVRAPRSLHEQAQRLRLRRPAEGTLRWAPNMSYAAAVVVIAALGYGVVAVTTARPDPAVSAVAAHAASTGTEVYGDVGQVSDFLKVHAPFAFHVPLPDRDGLKLIGARVTQLGTAPAVVYLYDVGGQRMTIAQYQAPEGGTPTGLKVDRQDGYVVATYADGGLLQTLVGNVPERDVSRILPASWGN